MKQDCKCFTVLIIDIFAFIAGFVVMERSLFWILILAFVIDKT